MTEERKYECPRCSGMGVVLTLTFCERTEEGREMKEWRTVHLCSRCLAAALEARYGVREIGKKGG